MNFSRRTSGEEGLELLRESSEDAGDTVILITAWGSIALAVEGMKAGAVGLRHQAVDESANAAGRRRRARAGRDRRAGRRARRSTREELDARYDFGDLVGNDARMLRHPSAGRPRGATDASVLITGESGTGKELVAEAIHRNSRRAERAVRQGQSRRHLRVAVRERDVRPHARRLHRRPRRPQGPIRGGATAERSSSTRSAISIRRRR